MKSKLVYIFLSFVISIGLGLGFSTVASPMPAAKTPIKIGWLIPLTGKFAKYGEMQKKSVEKALTDINAAGGINGRKLELLIEDTASKPATGKAAVEKLITRDKVPLIGSGYSSGVAWAYAPVCQLNKVPFLDTTPAADKITQQGWDYIFRMAPAASMYSTGLFDWLKHIGVPKTACLFHEQSSYGTSAARAMEKWLKKNGCKVYMIEAFESGTPDFRPMLSKFKVKNPDMIWGCCYLLDAINILKQAKEMKVAPKIFSGSGGAWTMPELPEKAGDAANYIIVGAQWVSNVPYPGAKDYDQWYFKTYAVHPSFVACEQYAGVYVVADALRRAKSISPEAIKKALLKTDLMTAFGRVKFETWTENGKTWTNQVKVKTFAAQILKGVLQTIWPKDIATAKYVYPYPKWGER